MQDLLMIWQCVVHQEDGLADVKRVVSSVATGALTQQQLAGMNMGQMQLLQPMGAGGVPAGITAAGVHPGVAGQGMMWPMNAANMQQANLLQQAQFMQQQQAGNPAVAQQPPASQPPAG